MQVIRAEHLGMCFGVRDAIALALDRAEAAPLTILGDLVHNAGGAGEHCAPGGSRSRMTHRRWTPTR